MSLENIMVKLQHLLAVKQSDLDLQWTAEMVDRYFGENIRQCIQCGNCTGTCPMSDQMDLGPRKVIAMVREGMKDEVLKCNTMWICASCYECAVECPKEIKITDVMYALKQYAQKAHTVPHGVTWPIMSKEFFNLVKKHGRNRELILMMLVVLKTNWLRGLELAPMGIKLLMQGRLTLIEKGISLRTRKKGNLKTILDAIQD